MFKSALLLGLFLVASTTNAAGLTMLNFWPDMYRKGRMMECPMPDYDVCYRIPDQFINMGLSSASFENGNIEVNKLAVTLYSGYGCNERMDRWGFTRGSLDAPYYIEYFQSLNDNVRSFKIAARDLSTTSGPARKDLEPTRLAS
ncbi:hypothetical protein BGX24_006298, partial [Mortierella sp. AD032]